MSTLTAANTQYALAQDLAFLERVQIAAITIAAQVQSEATSTSNDTKRSQFAAAVLNSPAAYVAQLALGVVTQNDPATSALVTAAVSDANIQIILSSLWNAFAGRV